MILLITVPPCSLLRPCPDPLTLSPRSFPQHWAAMSLNCVTQRHRCGDVSHFSTKRFPQQLVWKRFNCLPGALTPEQKLLLYFLLWRQSLAAVFLSVPAVLFTSVLSACPCHPPVFRPACQCHDGGNFIITTISCVDGGRSFGWITWQTKNSDQNATHRNWATDCQHNVLSQCILLYGNCRSEWCVTFLSKYQRNMSSLIDEQ